MFYWRESRNDGLYGPALNLIRPDRESSARYVGTRAEVVLWWQAGRNFSLRAVFAVFQPGRFIAQTGPARAVHFVLAEVIFVY